MIAGCNLEELPLVWSWRAEICSYTADSSAPVPQAKSAIRRLHMASASGPVHALHLGDGKPGQQRRRRRKSIEGGEVFPIGDEALEDAAR